MRWKRNFCTLNPISYDILFPQSPNSGSTTAIAEETGADFGQYFARRITKMLSKESFGRGVCCSTRHLSALLTFNRSARADQRHKRQAI